MALIRSSLTTPSSVARPDVGWDANVVWLRGEHDLATVAAVSEVIDRAIAFDDADLIIDLSEVSFMDAALVGVIVQTRGQLRPRALVLRSPSRAVRRVFEVCRLSDLFESEPAAASAPEAADALRSWVAIPATDRVDSTAEPSAPALPPIHQPVRENPAAGTVGAADERVSNPVGSGSA